MLRVRRYNYFQKLTNSQSLLLRCPHKYSIMWRVISCDRNIVFLLDSKVGLKASLGGSLESARLILRLSGWTFPVWFLDPSEDVSVVPWPFRSPWYRWLTLTNPSCGFITVNYVSFDSTMLALERIRSFSFCEDLEILYQDFLSNWNLYHQSSMWRCRWVYQPPFPGRLMLSCDLTWHLYSVVSAISYLLVIFWQ